MNEALFTDKQIRENPLYAKLMHELNSTYSYFGHPDSPSESGPTTGSNFREYWQSDNIGDWEGNECEVADWANEKLDEVYAGIYRCGNGGISYFHQSDDWSDFDESAMYRIEAFHNAFAFDILCGIPIDEMGL